MKLDEIKIYRMTHLKNIPHILEFGITHKNSQHRNPNYVNIGDISLIDNRSTRTVYVDNGNYLNLNISTITLGDFTPFYFGVRMPMLYVVQNGGNFVENATSPKDIVYLACSLQSIIDSGINYFFSDGHATDNLTSFYDRSKTNEIINIIDWAAIKRSYWGGMENLDIKRKKQAEFLIEGDIPTRHIILFGCYNEETKTKLIDLGIEENKIKVVPHAYY